MIIRNASPSDADAIATLLLLAMEDIVYEFIGAPDPLEAKAFLLHFVEGEDNQYSYLNCRVAEEGGEVVGAVNVYDGARLHALRQPVVDYIRRHYCKDFEPEDETGPGEYYIDSLGVHPGCHGKGTGTRLLRHLVEEFVVGQGGTLGLLVDEENPGARRLYTRTGFTAVGERVLFGKKMEHLQLRRDALRPENNQPGSHPV